MCGLEESEGHTHDETCYDEEGNLACGLEESEGHTHTDECYEYQITCGLEEHTHSVECLIDESADLETAEIWEATLPALSGSWADDLISIARSQVGYSESVDNYVISDDGVTHRSYTRYGEWAGNPYGDWDAMFASFCLSYAGISREVFPESTGAYAWAVELSGLGYYADAAEYTPEAGDLIFFDKDSDGKIDHVGIVSFSDGSVVTVIEGNYNDAVWENTYARNDNAAIIGYGILPEQFAEAETEEDPTEEEIIIDAEEEPEEEIVEIADEPDEEASEAVEFTMQTLTVTSGDAVITVSGLLPENAVVTAVPVDIEIDGKEVLLAFDISITYQDANGETVVFEPENGAVTVTIESAEITGGSDVYYVPDEGEPKQLETDSEDGTIAFDAEHFSTYAVTSSDTVVATGTIDNGEGVADAITWTIYEDDDGNRTLVFEGTGSIPDYASENAGQPWYSYRSTIGTLILGEGITRVGNQAFYGNYFTDIQFSSTVTSIGQYAFSYSQKLQSITIPGTVTTIEQLAFAYSYNLWDVTLEEGITTIGNTAFGGNCGSNIDCSDVVITIPASVTSLGSYPFAMAAKYAVADGSTTFSVDSDGVLYSYDGSTLVDYPKRRVADSWTVPETVTTIKTGALQNVKYTNEIYVMHQVDIPDMCFRDSSYTYVYIDDDVSIPASRGYLFYPNTNLTGVHIPENTALKIGGSYFSGCTGLQSIKIPKGTTAIDNSAFANTTNLETMYYDAAHITSISATTFGTSNPTMPLFDLTIGTNVDYLVANFSYILAHANSVTIEGPNAFYIEDGAFDNAPAPYTGLSGWIYVDDNGVIYTLDTDTYEATLYYIPDGLTSLTVPETISDQLDGTTDVTFTVTTVAKDALKEASDLTSITFEDTSEITTLEAYALANAPIASVTDAATGTTATTVDDATALFTNATIGYNAFYNTELTGATKAVDFSSNMDGAQTVSVGDMTITVVSNSDFSTKWEGTTTEGGYVSLTGETVKFSVDVNSESGSAQKYHIYVKATDDDCSLNYTAGNTYLVNGVTVIATATDDPYTICLEFTVEAGGTVNFTVDAVYPSPTSDGGGVTVWGAVVENGSETLTENEIEAYWKTQPEKYTLTKTNNNQNSVTIVSSDGTVRPSAELKWQIVLDGTDASQYGEDYITFVTYTDFITLPNGMEWDADILAAIKAGNVTSRSNTLYVGTIQIAKLSLGTTTNLSLSGFDISYDETTQQVVITWKVRNTASTSTDMYTNTLNLSVYPVALTVDMDEYDTTDSNVITNTVDATINYTYSSSSEKTATVDKTVTGGAGSVKISKTGTDASYFGEDVTYTISVYNEGGLTYTDTEKRTYTVTDNLTSDFYISADNMETMFEDAAKDGTELVITIAKAKLAIDKGSTVTDTDGTQNSALVNTGNSDLDETEDNTLVITYDSDNDKFTVTVNGSDEYTGDSIEELLQKLGYGVTSTVTYSCVWTLPTDSDGYFTIPGGGSYTYNIYSTVKSTFQLLDNSDWPGEYPKTSEKTLTNSATLAYGTTKSTASSSTKPTVKREATIDKSVAKNGEDLGSSIEASNGDVLDYTLTFNHYGDGSYDDLPMVDDLYGSQYLLVPIEQNKDNASVNGCDTYDIDEDGIADYCILKAGSYTDVVVCQDADGNWMTAATITVSSNSSEETFTVNGESHTWSGIHTQIKWYFDHLDGGNYEIELSYKALVDTSGSASYTIGNMVWMNDREGSRIYAGLWGGGTIIGYDKDIVVATGSEGDEDDDGLDDDKYTIVSEGETVTYRLTLESTGDSGSFVLTGANIADQLPNTYGVFDWSKSNVSISKVEVDDSKGGSVSGEQDLMSKWSITDSYNGVSGSFIVWDSDVSVAFSKNATVYIYVELTYPTNNETVLNADGETVGVWNEYADQAQGATVSNVFYVYRNPANVTHVLAREGEVTLQKGVYALLRSTSSMGLGTASGGYYYTTGSNRNYYNNQDSNYRYVAYYVSLYNGASTRLYLNDLYDVLPEGFVYTTMLTNNYSFGSYLTSTNVITTYTRSNSLTSWFIETDSDTDYMSASVTATEKSDGTVVFSFSAGSGTYAVKYDEDMGQYYLDSGEAIVFGYIAQIGLTADTEDIATNTIAMSYTDYTGAGVTESDKTFEARSFEPYGSSDNEGDCSVESSSYVKSEYGFDDGKGNQSWLVSSVSLE